MIEYKINKNNPDLEIIKKATNAIKNGQIVIFPCDTSYGLAADPTNKKAIDRLYQIKGDTKNKPLSVIVKDKKMAKHFAIFTKETEQIFDRYLPGEVTLIYPAKLPDFLPGQNPSFRIPNTIITNAMSALIDIPYTATSANLTRLKSANTPEEINLYFSGKKPQPEIFLNAGVLEEKEASTVVDLTTALPIILRQGSVNIEF